MSLPHTSGAYALGPDDGEALWFNGALGILRATADQTEGRFAAFELRPRKGFASPLHAHKDEDEFFLVLSGNVRLQHGDDVVEGERGRSSTHPAASATPSTSTQTRPDCCSSSDLRAWKGSSVRPPRLHAPSASRRPRSRCPTGMRWSR